MSVLLVSKCSSSLIFVIEHSKIKTHLTLRATLPYQQWPNTTSNDPFSSSVWFEVEGGGGGGGTFLQSHVCCVLHDLAG
jgi:hypothetical protein